MVVRQQDIRGFDPKRIVILASGSQAEAMSSLSRIAVDNHRHVSVDENDSVILSARIIPGNEKAIFRMLDHMFRRRALVYYDNFRGHDSCFGSRKPGRTKTPAATREAEIFHPHSRRIPPSFPPRRARASTRRGVRRNPP